MRLAGVFCVARLVVVNVLKLGQLVDVYFASQLLMICTHTSYIYIGNCESQCLCSLCSGPINGRTMVIFQQCYSIVCQKSTSIVVSCHNAHPTPINLYPHSAPPPLPAGIFLQETIYDPPHRASHPHYTRTHLHPAQPNPRLTLSSPQRFFFCRKWSGLEAPQPNSTQPNRTKPNQPDTTNTNTNPHRYLLAGNGLLWKCSASAPRPPRAPVPPPEGQEGPEGPEAPPPSTLPGMLPVLPRCSPHLMPSNDCNFAAGDADLASPLFALSSAE